MATAVEMLKAAVQRAIAKIHGQDALNAQLLEQLTAINQATADLDAAVGADPAPPVEGSGPQ